MNLHVISACFYADTSPARRLIQSCERFGLPLHLYGVGEPFVSWFDAKVVRLRRELDKFDDDTLILFSDAADTWFLGYDGQFDGWGADDVFFAGEANCWPYGYLRDCFNYGPYRYPNCGVFAARAKHLRYYLDIVAKYPIPNEENDQAYWHVAIATRQVMATVDSTASAFQCMDSVKLGETLIKDNGVLTNTERNTTPFLVHFNGGNKEARMQEFEAWFNG